MSNYWSMYEDVTNYRNLALEHKKVRPNVVRIIPLTQNDVSKLLNVGAPLGTLQSLVQDFKIFNEPAINAFYGKLAPEKRRHRLNSSLCF